MGDNRGSITVEMTLIMITSLSITFMIIMTGMYLWDMNRLQTLAERYVLQVVEARSENWKTGTSQKDWNCWSQTYLPDKEPDLSDKLWLENKYKERLTDGFFFLGEVEVYAEVDSSRASLRVSGDWRCPLQSLFLSEAFSFDFISSREYKKTEMIQIIHGILRGLGG